MRPFPTGFTRRHFLKSSTLTLGALSLPLGLPYRALAAPRSFSLDEASPIASVTNAASVDFNGSEYDRPHKLLWDKVVYLRDKGGIPVPEKEVDVVIVGGGIAGLIAAYELRDKNIVLLEGSSRFGGNAKGERYGESDYSIGAAYVTRPEPGDASESLLKELGLWQRGRLEEGHDATVNLKNKLVPGFWEGAASPDQAQKFKEVFEKLLWIGENAYPDIPLLSDSQISMEEFKRLDEMNFESWLKETFGPVPPALQEFLELYAWSSFAGTLSELSTAQMLNFITSDLSGTIALPGGNAAIAQALYEKLSGKLSPSQMQSDAFVIDVTADETGVTIAYEGKDRVFRSIRAKTCIMTAPKYVVRRVMDKLEYPQSKAMRELKHRSYVVANLLIDGKIDSPSYELFRLEGKVPPAPTGMKSEPRPYSDVVFGTWAAKDQVDHGVLTFYKAYAVDGVEQMLWRDHAHQKQKETFEKDLPGLLGAIGVPESRVKGLRLTRWGHALPVASTGLISGGVCQRASEPYRGRVFFANQDNWANPAFETSLSSAQTAAKAALGLL